MTRTTSVGVAMLIFTTLAAHASVAPDSRAVDANLPTASTASPLRLGLHLAPRASLLQVARRGADDGPLHDVGDDRGARARANGGRATSRSGDDNGGTRAGGRGRGADDGAGHNGRSSGGHSGSSSSSGGSSSGSGSSGGGHGGGGNSGSGGGGSGGGNGGSGGGRH